MRIFSRFFSLLIFFLLAETAGLAEPAYKLALVLPLSGTAQAEGLGERQAVELALADEAALLKSLPFSLDLETVDDPQDPEEAARSAAHLASDLSVLAVLGHRWGGSALAAAAVYSQHGLLMVSPLCTDTRLTSKGWDNVFRLAPRDDQQGRAAARFALARSHKHKALILHDGSPSGLSQAQSFRDGLRARGVRELAFLELGPKDPTDPAFFSRLKGFGPNLVYFGGEASLAAELVVGLKQAGVQFLFLGGDRLYSQSFLDQAGDAAEGTLVSALAPDLRKVRSRALITFRRRYRSRFHEAPRPSTPATYMAARLIVQALAEAAAPGREELKGAFAGLSVEQGLLGPVRFDSRGDNKARSGEAKVYFFLAHRNSNSKKMDFTFYLED
jgi:branched-chain amino acid transport system substrate-binding protein